MDDTRDGLKESITDGHPSIRLVPIEHDEYDALADLFLGGGGLAPEPIEEAGDALSHETHTPVLHLTRDDESLESDAECEVETDADGMVGRGVLESIEATGQQASALMAELMGNAGEALDDDIELVRMPRPSVEAVVLGHLPVRATLWARQYACTSAKDRGEIVGLVRAASGTTAIDLITGREPVSADGGSSLDRAVQTLHDRADRVILRVDERREPELLDRPEIETITVLTGADETAVVASYRLVKTINAALCERYEDAGDGARVRVAVMGAPREQALDAQAKLQSAVDSFIERPVEIVIGSGRIDATGTSNIFRDTRAHGAGRLIDRLVDLEHAGDELHEAVVETRVVDPADVEARAIERKTEDERVKDEPEHEPEHDVSPGLRDGLCAMIEGVRPIEARCPKAPGVELGRDDAGRLHLVVCDADCDGALERLYTAQSWTRDHLALLLRAEPGLMIPSSDAGDESEAVMHLISHEPAMLRNIYDTPVRMYALARVRVGGVIAQVATALN